MYIINIQNIPTDDVIELEYDRTNPDVCFVNNRDAFGPFPQKITWGRILGAINRLRLSNGRTIGSYVAKSDCVEESMSKLDKVDKSGIRLSYFVGNYINEFFEK